MSIENNEFILKPGIQIKRGQFVCRAGKLILILHSDNEMVYGYGIQKDTYAALQKIKTGVAPIEAITCENKRIAIEVNLNYVDLNPDNIVYL